jgi:hypothetical protein
MHTSMLTLHLLLFLGYPVDTLVSVLHQATPSVSHYHSQYSDFSRL